VIDRNVTGYFECIINTMGCPPLNEKHMLETTEVSEVCKEFKVKWKEFILMILGVYKPVQRENLEVCESCGKQF